MPMLVQKKENPIIHPHPSKTHPNRLFKIIKNEWYFHLYKRNKSSLFILKTEKKPICSRIKTPPISYHQPKHIYHTSIQTVDNAKRKRENQISIFITLYRMEKLRENEEKLNGEKLGVLFGQTARLNVFVFGSVNTHV